MGWETPRMTGLQMIAQLLRLSAKVAQRRAQELSIRGLQQAVSLRRLHEPPEETPSTNKDGEP